MLNKSDNDKIVNKAKICPNNNCSFNIHAEDANFCILCGTLLYERCNDCLEVNPRYAKFCHYCGACIEDLRNLSPRFGQEDNAESGG